MEMIINALREKKEIEKASIFGSRSMGNYKNGSDIDIVIYGAKITDKTLNELSIELGVSVTVVSRVINNKGYVSMEKRERVEKAIEELGYRPNLIAQSLKTNQTRQILFYAPELANPFYVEVYRGMEDYAEQHNYTIVVSRYFDDGMIQQRRFDGVILSDILPEQQDKFLKLGVPVVVTNYTGVRLRIPSVGIAMKEGACQAISYLWKCGHRRIGFITNVCSCHEQRFLGYVEELYMKDKYGHVRGFGSRRHYCYNSPIYHKYTKRIVSKMAEHYGDNPNVIAWQIDNEFGCQDTGQCYCQNCLLAFRKWLKGKYESLDDLNRTWGTIFWSQI